MSLYDQRLAQDLDTLNQTIAEVAEQIQQNLRNALAALKTLDKKLAYETILADHPINRRSEDIDQKCHYFVARHLPSAGHLRFISSVMRLNIGLERIGDYASSICREVVQIKKPLTPELAKITEQLANDAFEMMHRAIQAFIERDAEQARAAKSYADQVAGYLEKGLEELAQNSDQPIDQILKIMVILSRIRRVASQAKNICEETVFVVTGQTKKRKPVRVLFLDRDNGVYSRTAVAVGRKAFPNSGRFVSAGLEASDASHESWLNNLTEKGCMPPREEFRSVEFEKANLSSYDVVVSLAGPVSDYISDIPFHTVALEWNVPSLDGKDADKASDFEETYREISVAVRDLLTTMRGEGAD